MAKVAKIYDGTAWVDLATSVPDLSNYQLKSETGLQLVKKQTINTAVSSVTVTDAFSAAYDNYKIMISGGAANNTGFLSLQLGSTTSGYYGGYTGFIYGNGAANIGNTNNGASFGQAGFVTTEFINLDINVVNPFLTKRTLMNGAFVGNSVGGVVSGLQDSNTSFTAFTVTPIAGATTLTGGTIYVYGYNKG